MISLYCILPILFHIICIVCVYHIVIYYTVLYCIFLAYCIVAYHIVLDQIRLVSIIYINVYVCVRTYHIVLLPQLWSVSPAASAALRSLLVLLRSGAARSAGRSVGRSARRSGGTSPGCRICQACFTTCSYSALVEIVNRHL